MFDEIKALDVKERAEIYGRLIENGIVSPNEVREAEGLPPNECGDTKCQRVKATNIECKALGEDTAETAKRIAKAIEELVEARRPVYKRTD